MSAKYNIFMFNDAVVTEIIKEVLKKHHAHNYTKLATKIIEKLHENNISFFVEDMDTIEKQ